MLADYSYTADIEDAPKRKTSSSALVERMKKQILAAKRPFSKEQLEQAAKGMPNHFFHAGDADQS